MLNSTVVYSALQAFVVLAICELALPTEMTEGQGSLWMWGALLRHPALLINAFNNTVYWVAFAFVLRESLGVVLVVLAFLVAGFMTAPLEALVGLDSDHGADAVACVLAVAGAVLCLVPVPAVLAGADAAIVRALCPCRTAAVADLARGGRHQYSEVGREDSGDSLLDRADAGTVAAAPRKEPAVAPGAAVEAPAAAAQPPPPSSPAGLLRLRTPAWALALAWAVLAGTAAIGIVCTTYFEHSLGLSMFGYAAVDQVLLPFTTLPLTAAAVRVAWVADLIGEPAEGRDATVRASLGRTWAEADWRTLVPFRASMFGREFLFFWLVTAFSDLTTTYLQMTILRVVLCWLASLLVCAFFRAWSGVSDEEADGALRPSTLLFRLAGSAVLVASYLRLQGVL